MPQYHFPTSLLVNLLLFQTICSSFVIDEFQRLYNEDEILGQYFTLSSREHTVMKAAKPS